MSVGVSRKAPSTVHSNRRCQLVASTRVLNKTQIVCVKDYWDERLIDEGFSLGHTDRQSKSAWSQVTGISLLIPRTRFSSSGRELLSK